MVLGPRRSFLVTPPTTIYSCSGTSSSTPWYRRESHSCVVSCKGSHSSMDVFGHSPRTPPTHTQALTHTYSFTPVVPWSLPLGLILRLSGWNRYQSERRHN